MLNYALRPAFTPLTLLLMVLGFIVFWPLGLAMLAYMMWGSRFPEIRRHFEGVRSDWANRDWSCGPGWSRGGGRGYRGYSRSGNVAFDDYRQKELQRLEEERRRLDEDLREFESYMADLRRARDQDEFDRFMRQRSERQRSGGSGAGSARNGDNVDL